MSEMGEESEPEPKRDGSLLNFASEDEDGVLEVAAAAAAAAEEEEDEESDDDDDEESDEEGIFCDCWVLD